LTKRFLALQANLKPSAALVSFDQALKILPLKHRKSSSYHGFVLFSMGAWSKDTSAALGRVSYTWKLGRPREAKFTLVLFSSPWAPGQKRHKRGAGPGILLIEPEKTKLA
jgi:hypothetical protein